MPLERVVLTPVIQGILGSIIIFTVSDKLPGIPGNGKKELAGISGRDWANANTPPIGDPIGITSSLRMDWEGDCNRERVAGVMLGRVRGTEDV